MDPSTAQRRELRVATWNLHGSAGPDLRRVTMELRRLDPDLVGLQEVRAVHARRLARELGWTSTWAFKHFPLTPVVWWRAEGMAILSRHPVTSTGRMGLTPGVSRSSHRRRIAQWADVQCPGGSLRLVNVHLTAHRTGTSARAGEAATVGGLVRDPATILTGDLNAPEEPEVLRPLAAAGLRDAWSGPGPGHTNPAATASQRLDYVLVGEAFEILECSVPVGSAEWAELSDHLPVTAVVRPVAPVS